MKKISNISEIDWYPTIKDNQIYKGIFLQDLFPADFEKYCKILNPFYISPNYKKLKRKKWNMKKLIEEFLGEAGEHVDAIINYKTTDYKHICKLLKIEYRSNISSDIISVKRRNNQPKWFLFPDEGTIANEIINDLTEILKNHTDKSSCYFFYTSYAIDTMHDTIFNGTLQEFPNTYEIGQSGTPTYVWPEDKKWCIYTNYDTDFSIIGGTKELINNILNNKKLETFELSENFKFD